MRRSEVDWFAVAKKAVATRKSNQLKIKHRNAALKAWVTRRNNVILNKEGKI